MHSYLHPHGTRLRTVTLGFMNPTCYEGPTAIAHSQPCLPPMIRGMVWLYGWWLPCNGRVPYEPRLVALSPDETESGIKTFTHRTHKVYSRKAYITQHGVLRTRTHTWFAIR